MTSLTKENFWDELYAKYPGEVQLFYTWLEEYSNKNDWHPYTNTEDSITYFEMPLAVQVGIFLQFVAEQKSGLLEMAIEHPSDFEKIPELIREYFFYEHDDAVHDHQQGKYINDVAGNNF